VPTLQTGERFSVKRYEEIAAYMQNFETYLSRPYMKDKTLFKNKLSLTLLNGKAQECSLNGVIYHFCSPYKIPESGEPIKLTPSEIGSLITNRNLIPIDTDYDYTNSLPNFKGIIENYFKDLAEYSAVWFQNIFAKVINNLPNDSHLKRSKDKQEFLWHLYKIKKDDADGIFYFGTETDIDDILNFPK
jgi:hypothetical protein